MSNTRLSPQQRKVLKVLANGGCVSKVTALHQRVGNIHEVIRQIKKRGWEVKTNYAQDINNDTYVKYELAERQRGAAREYTTVSQLVA